MQLTFIEKYLDGSILEYNGSFKYSFKHILGLCVCNFCFFVVVVLFCCFFFYKGMLHYQSSLLQSLNTVFYSLPMVLGISEEKQNVEITLFENYVEDSVS